MELNTMHAATFPKPRRAMKLFSDFNNLQFSSVMALVFFVLLLAFMIDTKPYHYFSSVDLPKVLHPIPMRGADREDAMKISITRDARVYFGSDQVRDPSALLNQIRSHLKEPDVEHKIYIVADKRVRWGMVKLVLQDAHEAGIMRVAFLAEQRHLL